MMFSLCILSLSMAYDTNLSLYITSCNQGVSNHTLWYIKTCSHGVSYHVIFSIFFTSLLLVFIISSIIVYCIKACCVQCYVIVVCYSMISQYITLFLRCIIVSAIVYQIIFSWYVISLLMVDYIMLSCCVNVCHHGIFCLHVIMLSCYHVIMVIMLSYYIVAIHAVWMASWYKIHFNIYMMSLLMVY